MVYISTGRGRHYEALEVANGKPILAYQRFPERGQFVAVALMEAANPETAIRIEVAGRGTFLVRYRGKGDNPFEIVTPAMLADGTLADSGGDITPL